MKFDADLAYAVTSLERIDDYIDIEQEPKPNASGEPPAYWPASGDIKVENLHARYSSDGPEVLKNISFHIKSGERIGVGTCQTDFLCFEICLILGLKVGRTGSGKVRALNRKTTE